MCSTNRRCDYDIRNWRLWNGKSNDDGWYVTNGWKLNEHEPVFQSKIRLRGLFQDPALFTGVSEANHAACKREHPEAVLEQGD